MAIGGIGIIIPILPTTPFVICAAGCFGVSNPALAQRLEDSRYFGEYIKNYRTKCGISTGTKAKGITFLWLALLISAVIINNPKIWVVLAVVGISVTIHILVVGRKRKV